MGVEIRDTILTCDLKGCEESTPTNATDRSEIEVLGWGVAASSSDTSKWKVYCPEHRWILKLLQDVLKEGQINKQLSA